MGDDGIGPYVVRHLAATWELPPEVSVLDGGTPGPDLVDYLVGREAVVLVDAIRAPAGSSPDSESEPGTVRIYRKETLARVPVLPRLSPHDPDLPQALLTAELAGEAPEEVVLVGVLPERVEAGTELSPALRAAVPEIERAVLDELARLGVEARRREAPLDAEIWWEREEERV
jgi:hydrogenase maturation protease